MDPIDRISAVLEKSCEERLAYFQKIQRIINRSRTFFEAEQRIHRKGQAKVNINMRQMILNLPHEIERLKHCLRDMDLIKVLARKVLKVNFLSEEKFFTFNQEVSFSYACKMQSSVGPSLQHFSNCESISINDIRSAEVQLALNSPSYFTGPDLLCHEDMPEECRSPPPIEIPSSPSAEVCLNLEEYGIVTLDYLS
jgi:hypothetical protein